MCLKKQEREFFRKLLDNFIVKNPHFKRCQVVDHFVNEGIARQTVYNAINRRENGQSILEINFNTEISYGWLKAKEGCALLHK
jgi:hypothetical protein